MELTITDVIACIALLCSVIALYFQFFRRKTSIIINSSQVDENENGNNALIFSFTLSNSGNTNYILNSATMGLLVESAYFYQPSKLLNTTLPILIVAGSIHTITVKFAENIFESKMLFENRSSIDGSLRLNLNFISHNGKPKNLDIEYATASLEIQNHEATWLFSDDVNEKNLMARYPRFKSRPLITAWKRFDDDGIKWEEQC